VSSKTELNFSFDAMVISRVKVEEPSFFALNYSFVFILRYVCLNGFF
jgi:hypothetical protein